jgi:hypothetical protein
MKVVAVMTKGSFDRERNVGRPTHNYRYPQICGKIKLVRRRRTPSDVCNGVFVNNKS